MLPTTSFFTPGNRLRPTTKAEHPNLAWSDGREPSAAMTGVWRSVRRVLNREGNWYEEEVLNPDGSVHHYASHPLSEHKGHGSDKPTKSG